MSTRENCNKPSQQSDIELILLSGQIGIIAVEIAKRLSVSPMEAFSMFYESKTCADLHNKATNLYLYSDLYIVDEFMIEYKARQNKRAEP